MVRISKCRDGYRLNIIGASDLSPVAAQVVILASSKGRRRNKQAEAASDEWTRGAPTVHRVQSAEKGSDKEKSKDEGQKQRQERKRIE